MYLANIYPVYEYFFCIWLCYIHVYLPVKPPNACQTSEFLSKMTLFLFYPILRPISVTIATLKVKSILNHNTWINYIIIKQLKEKVVQKPSCFLASERVVCVGGGGGGGGKNG